MANDLPVQPVTCLLQDIFLRYDKVLAERQAEETRMRVRRTALENYLEMSSKKEQNGFQRMQKCRQGLEALDRRGWTRSFHQRMFHDNFIRSCARIFWKREPHGTFAKDHQKILEVNGWDHLAQEVLVSTPRRFGKTISVSMFAAAMLYSCPNLEMSIYSTCKVSFRHVCCANGHGVSDVLHCLFTENLPEIIKEYPEVSGAYLFGDRLLAHEGDPHQHGGDRAAGDRVRARRPRRQLVPEQGTSRAPSAVSRTKRQ
jgi:hypothetical protein